MERKHESMVKRGILVALLIIFACTGLVALFSVEPTTGAFAGGDGSSSNPYQIATIEDLYEVRDNLTAYYVLNNDLDFTDDTDYEDASNKTQFISGEGWTPIGAVPYETTAFTGYFDGAGYTISNLFIEGDGYGNYGHMGLFGWVSGPAQIHDLGLIDVNITVTPTGNEAVGALIGTLSGQGGGLSSVYGCYSTGLISTGIKSGGLIGRLGSGGSVYRCFSSVNVTGTAGVGGLIGWIPLADGAGGSAQNTLVQDCYATGAISGSDYVAGLIGLIGNPDAKTATIDNCYSTGAITNSSSTGIGGLIGDAHASVSVTNCFWDNQTSGKLTSDGGTAKTTAQLKDWDTFNDAGWTIQEVSYEDANVPWIIQDGSDYPRLAGWEIANLMEGGTGTSGDPYQINYLEQLSMIRSDYYGIPYNEKCYTLSRDLDFDNSSHYLDSDSLTAYTTGDGWHPVGLIPNGGYGGAFLGTFDGGNYTISNLFINSTGGQDSYGHTGLFGFVGTESTGTVTIENLRLVDVDITVTGAETNQCAGALIGASWGADLTVSNCFATGTITGENRTGGLIGRLKQGTVEYCFSNVTVTGDSEVGGFIGRMSLDGGYGSQVYNTEISNCYATGNATGTAYLGGFIGNMLDGDAVYTTLIDDCYSSGYVTNSSSVSIGGFIGANGTNISVTNCFWDTQTSGQSTSASGTGKTTTLMYDYDTFNDAGWDINTTANWTIELWWIQDGSDYPRLEAVEGNPPPNSSPSNDGCTITNLDDTDNIYAQLRNYIATVNVSDPDGYGDLTTIDLTIQTGGATERITFRYAEDTDTFSELSGSTTAWTLTTGSCTSARSGNDCDLAFYFMAEWDSTEESDLDIKVVTTDSASATDTDTYDLNVDVVTNLVVSNFACDDDRGDISQTIVFTGTVYYANDPSSSTATTFYPPDAEFTTIHVYDDWNNDEGNDSTIVNGAFSVSFTANSTVGLETYNPYINMADADYTDAEESPTDTYIADNVGVSFSVDDSAPYVGETVTFTVALTRDYDSSSVSSYVYTVTRNSSAFQTNLSSATFTDTNGTTVVYSYDFTAVTDSTYGLDSFTDPSNLSVEWVNIYITLQARDKNSANLPRAVTFSGTKPNSATFSVSSSSAGLYSLSVTNGTLTVYTWWGGNLVNSTTYTCSSNATLNINTQISKLTDSSNYVIWSINQTTIDNPSLTALNGYKVDVVGGSGQQRLVVDDTNWVRTTPIQLSIAGSTYTSSSWTYESNVLTKDYLDFDTFSSQTVEVIYEIGGGGGGGGGVTYPTPTPYPTPTDTPSYPTPTPSDGDWWNPELPEFSLTDDQLKAVAIVAVVAIATVVVVSIYNQTSADRRVNQLPKTSARRRR